MHGYDWPRPLFLRFSLFCSSNSDLLENLLQSVYLHMKCNTRRIREGLCYLYVDEFERILGKIQSWNKYREYCDNPRSMKHLRRVSSGLVIYIASDAFLPQLFHYLIPESKVLCSVILKNYQNDSFSINVLYYSYCRWLFYICALIWWSERAIKWDLRGKTNTH